MGDISKAIEIRDNDNRVLNRATRIWLVMFHKSVAFVCWFHMFGLLAINARLNRGKSLISSKIRIWTGEKTRQRKTRSTTQSSIDATGMNERMRYNSVGRAVVRGERRKPLCATLRRFCFRSSHEFMTSFSISNSRPVGYP